VLVTGAGGFIGSHLVERLVAEGASVRAFVRYSSTGSPGHLQDSRVLDQVEIVSGDVRDASFVSSVANDREVVFHLAALIGIPYSYEAPESYVQTNVVGTLNLLNAVRSKGSLLVSTSTSEVYGSARYVPIDEAHPLQAQSPYAASKIAADVLALSYHRSFQTRVTILRPFNAYGPRQSARAVIPAIISQLIAQPRVEIGAVDTERDFTYVSDTVEAFIRVGLCREAEGSVVNCGSGRSVTIGDLARLIGTIVGRQPELVISQQRIRPASSEVDRLRADSTRAHDLLRWTAGIPLEEGLRLTVEWIAAHPVAYRSGVYAS
jgi:dTDP-glucose 4,6-dehydratase